MCEKRHWKNLYPTGVTSEGFIIMARRSDEVNFNILVPATILINTSINPLEAFRDIILKIETYRTCSCNATEKCRMHSDKAIDLNFKGA